MHEKTVIKKYTLIFALVFFPICSPLISANIELFIEPTLVKGNRNITVYHDPGESTFKVCEVTVEKFLPHQISLKNNLDTLDLAITNGQRIYSLMHHRQMQIDTSRDTLKIYKKHPLSGQNILIDLDPEISKKILNILAFDLEDNKLTTKDFLSELFPQINPNSSKLNIDFIDSDKDIPPGCPMVLQDTTEIKRKMLVPGISITNQITTSYYALSLGDGLYLYLMFLEKNNIQRCYLIVTDAKTLKGLTRCSSFGRILINDL